MFFSSLIELSNSLNRLNLSDKRIFNKDVLNLKGVLLISFIVL
jgi:hypothetical protein